jgi:hypothetical protein
MATGSMAILYGGLKLSKIQNFAEMDAHLSKVRLSQMFEVIADEISIYHFYNSSNSLHDEFNSTFSEVLKNGCKKACCEVCSIDISELEEKDEVLIKVGLELICD